MVKLAKASNTPDESSAAGKRRQKRNKCMMREAEQLRGGCITRNIAYDRLLGHCPYVRRICVRVGGHIFTRSHM